MLLSTKADGQSALRMATGWLIADDFDRTQFHEQVADERPPDICNFALTHIIAVIRDGKRQGGLEA